jgi:hypothetical protein
MFFRCIKLHNISHIMSKNGDFNTKNLISIISGVPGARYRVKAVFKSTILGLLQGSGQGWEKTRVFLNIDQPAGFWVGSGWVIGFFWVVQK